MLPTNDSEISKLYFDVSGDNTFSALDALLVINALSRINRGGTPEGERSLQLVDLEQFGSLPSGTGSDDEADELELVVTGLGPARLPPSQAPAGATSLQISATDEWMQDYESDGDEAGQPSRADSGALELLLF